MEYLPLSKVNTVVYCPRRFYLEYVLGEAHANHHLIEGHYLHERAYTEPGEESGLWVWSDRLGLLGVVDRLEWRRGRPAPWSTSWAGPRKRPTSPMPCSLPLRPFVSGNPEGSRPGGDSFTTTKATPAGKWFSPQSSFAPWRRL